MKKLVIILILIALVFVAYKSFFNDESKINSFVASVPCTNECAVDSRMCVDDFTYQICGNYDQDSCSEWGDTGICNQETEICSNGNCISNIPCTDECTSGSRMCVDEFTYTICGNYDQDSCLEWGNLGICNEVCEKGECSPIITCNNECTLNSKRCAGNGFQTCSDYNADGCTEWGGISQCQSNQFCSNGNCLTQPRNPEPKCNSCSTNRPKYCNNGVLVNNCALCGCNNNGVCSNNGLCISINYTSSNDTTILIKSPSIKYIPKMSIDINKQLSLNLNNYVLNNEDVIIKFSGNKDTFNSELIDCNLNNNLLTCNPRNQGNIVLNLIASNSFKSKDFNINLEIVKNEEEINDVKKNKPVASLGRDVNAPINSYVILDSYLSYDQDNDLDENSFEWYEKDRLIGTGRSIKLIYSEIGLHEIRLVITDFSGLKDEDGILVNVINRNLCKNTNARYFPDDTLCNEKWPSQNGEVIIINSREYSCNLVEVCDESTDYIIEDAVNCCSGVDLQDSRKSNSCSFANKYSQGISKKCQALYLIKSLGSESIYMQGYLEAEMCCRGVEALCSSENNLYKAQPLPYTSRDLSDLRCYNSPSDNPPGRWISDFSLDKNNVALADLPAHVSLNKLSTGTCVDYSFSLTTLIRKLNYKQSEILTVEAPNHAYNLVRFPLDKKYTIVDTTGNNDPAIVFGSVPYGYAYCENIKNCYNDNGFILCPSLGEINGCENAKQSLLQETRFKGIRILDSLKEFGNLIIGEIEK